MKIVISGTTGVGKSTIVKKLKNYYNKQGKEVVVLQELILKNPYFKLYFKDNEKWNFLSQIDFLMERFKQWLIIEESLTHKDLKNKVIIYDRHFLEDIIFAELELVNQNKSQMILDAHQQLFFELVKKIKNYKKPDFFILLSASFETVMKRQFDKRNREIESKFNNNYWKDLYYRYYNSIRYRKIFKENTNHFLELDTDDNDPNEILNKIVKYIKKRKS